MKLRRKTMNKSFVNAVIEEIKSQPEVKNDYYETISVRPGLKIASMIEVFQKLSNKKISSMFTDGITSELYKYCLSDIHNVFVIKDVCSKLNSDENQIGLDQISGDDCLCLLKKNGAINFKAVPKSYYQTDRSDLWREEHPIRSISDKANEENDSCFFLHKYYVVTDPCSELKGKTVILTKEFPGPRYVVEYGRRCNWSK